MIDAIRDARGSRPPWLRLGAAVLFVLLASSLSAVLHRWLFPVPLAPYFAAVALSAWYGGANPAIAAIVLSLVPIDLLALEPRGEWGLSQADRAAIVTFLLVSALLVLLSASRDRAERALQGSEARLRGILETANEGIWLIDRQSRTLYANERMAALLRTTPDRILAGAALDFVFPDDVPAAQDHIGATLTGQPENFDFRFRRADGAEVLVLASTSPVRDGTGATVGALGLFTDVTARRLAEEKLRESEAHARFLASASAALAASLDYQQAVEHVVRLAVPSLADWCVVDLLGPDGALHRQAIVHGDPERVAVAEELLRHYPMLTPGDGHTAWAVLDSGEPRFDPEVSPDRLAAEARDEAHLAFLRQLGFASELVLPLVARGHPLGVLTLVMGASGRRYGPDDLALAEELSRHCALAIDNARLYREAREAEARVRRLFDAGVIGLLVADDERITEANDQFLRMVGYTRDDLAAGRLRWPEMTPPEYAPRDAAALAEIAERGFYAPFEKEYRRKDGTRVPILLGAAAIIGNGPPWICCVLDLTAQKAAEEDRIAFVDATTHDLKNPLTALKSRVQILLRRARRGEVLDAAALEPALLAIDAETGRMVAMIDQLLDAAHLRTGRPLALTPALTDLVALVRDTVAAMQPRTSQPIDFASAEAALVGQWDRLRLERVVQNILDNAIKYSPDGGAIVVRVGREQGPDGTAWATLSIRDEGIGIPAADLPNLFERFRRGSNSAGIGGAGLGLAGAQQIDAQHGGAIVVESVEGRGSMFTVRLPLA